MTKRKDRNSSIELLRIFSMFAIVMHHYAFYGSLNWQAYNFRIIGALRINLFLHYFGKLGVVLFVMIGAYFLCEKKFNYYRLINLMLTTAFYSFGIYFILKLFFPHYMFIPDSIIDVLLPFPLPTGYWFVYAYLVMLFAMPFLNIIINSLTPKKLQLLILALTLLWSFVTVGVMVFHNKPGTDVSYFAYSPASYFILIYFISAYIRKYSGKWLNSKKITGIGSLAILIFALLLTFIVRNQHLLNGYLAIVDVNSPIVLINAIFIFSFFKNYNFKSKFINYVASSMFAVYLIHEDSFLRPIIWNYIIPSKYFMHTALSYSISAIISSLVVFIVCIVIDTIVRKTYLASKIKKFSIYMNNLITKYVNNYLKS